MLPAGRSFLYTLWFGVFFRAYCIIQQSPATRSRGTICITGCSRGIGAEIARVLGSTVHEEQVQLIATARDVSYLEGSQIINRNAEHIHIQELDVSDPSSISLFCKWVKQEFGSIDCLINNAGICIQGNSRSTLLETLATNFWGPLNLTKELLESFRTDINKGSDAKMIVINISSGEGELCYLSSNIEKRFRSSQTVKDLMQAVKDLELGHDGNTELAFGPTPAYSVSKAALNAAVRLLHLEETRLRITAVCPGDVQTEMVSCRDMLGDKVNTPQEAALNILGVLENLQKGNRTMEGRFCRGEEILPF